MQNSQMEVANPFLKFNDIEHKLDQVLAALKLVPSEREFERVINELATMRRIIDESETVWCSVIEAAEILGCSKWNVYRKVESGHLHSKKVGGKVLVYKPDLLQ